MGCCSLFYTARKSAAFLLAGVSKFVANKSELIEPLPQREFTVHLTSASFLHLCLFCHSSESLLSLGVAIRLLIGYTMSTDFDPLDDIFADEIGTQAAKAVGKFQPKAKFRATKKGSASTSVHTSQAVQNLDSTQNKFTEPVVTAKPSEPWSDVAHHDNGGWHASMEKSTGVNADVFIGLDALGDFLSPTSIDEEAAAFTDANPHSSVEGSTISCKGDSVPIHPSTSQCINSFTTGEPIGPSSDIRDPLHTRELDREEVGPTGSLNVTELATQSGDKKGGSPSIPPEIDYADKDSTATFQQDDVLDFSSLDFTSSSPCEPASELPSNEESMNLMETVNLDSGIHSDGVTEIPAKLASRRAKTQSSGAHIAQDPSSQQPETSRNSHDNGSGRSLRPRKNKINFCELVDEDEGLHSVELSEECPVSSPTEEENNNEEEVQAESELKTKKSKSESGKTYDEKEKPARKRKKAKEASDQDAGAKPKKFSHSTRRKRVVDKVLLETPEDEIDYQKVPLRDLIARAEHQEKQMKKNEAEAGAPGTKQSNGNSSGSCNDEGTFISKQDGEYNVEQGSPIAEDTTEFFNYQTYMDKTPSTRWSKQDTELFYEAVRQFGTDLSMIEQLFPGRTRRQVKLKYKKEERQHPMRLRDALTNRTKDYSHFEEVIKRLKQIAAEEKQNGDKDDPIDLTGNEGADDGTTNADDEEPNGKEQTQEEENSDVANDKVEAQSPSKSDGGDDDDLFMWSQYTSS
ncbi:transcription factor tfiiib component [Striga asiatica]|uniref:Transcription factor tfiiib component n=1 Tax=Striga asiatica TaxID=4170 RepID=A0A5A7R1X2_STRAF|nr:transcription factor tfiiib component [Striga asiatica]